MPRACHNGSVIYSTGAPRIVARGKLRILVSHKPRLGVRAISTCVNHRISVGDENCCVSGTSRANPCLHLLTFSLTLSSRPNRGATRERLFRPIRDPR